MSNVTVSNTPARCIAADEEADLVFMRVHLHGEDKDKLDEMLRRLTAIEALLNDNNSIP